MTFDAVQAVGALPLISCIMPTYGRPRYVHEAVKMFLDQDYPAKELVILNDCAGQVFHCELPNVRVFNTSQRCSSLGEKRNECIKKSRGEFLAIWDDDDVYLPWRLSFSLAELQRWDTDFYRPDGFLAYWGEDFLHDNQTVPGWLSHPTVLLRKSLWEGVGGYAAQDTGEDAEFFARIHRHLGQEFIKYPTAQADRFMVLRGKSHYRHMSIGGGQQPLETQPGDYHIVPRPIADRQLRTLVNGLRTARRHESPDLLSSPSVQHDPAPAPLLSVCISIKNRSRVDYDEQARPTRTLGNLG
ncbi:MAG: glycosyltransferase family A protein [Planctomycetota bacterium]|nr:glycosyltransferase family A protein [Planctomycetota bacterium]